MSVATCPHCGATNYRDALSCTSCGLEIEVSDDFHDKTEPGIGLTLVDKEHQRSIEESTHNSEVAARVAPDDPIEQEPTLAGVESDRTHMSARSRTRDPDRSEPVASEEAEPTHVSFEFRPGASRTASGASSTTSSRSTHATHVPTNTDEESDVFREAGDVPSDTIELTPADIRLLRAIDGERDIDALAATTGMRPSAVHNALESLIERGLVIIHENVPRNAAHVTVLDKS